MTLPVLIGLFVSHFLGDFALQSDRLALGKSKSYWILAQHVALYSACFLWVGINFTAITYVLHYITDAVTSRITSKLWFIDMLNVPNPDVSDSRFVGRFNDNRHNFFVAIGADQLCHYVTLILTYRFFVSY